MRRSSALLVTLLLLASAFAPMGVGADDAAETNPLIVSINDSANYLTVSNQEVTRTAITTDGLSLSTAVSGDTAALQSEFSMVLFEQSFQEATTDAEKTAAIRTAADSAEGRHETLQKRDRAAVRAYANGSITASEFTRERARIYTAATDLRNSIRRIDTIARSEDGYSPRASQRVRLANVAGELEVLQGPVSDHVGQAAGGETDGQTIYAEATDDGYTLAYVTDDTYVRETYLGADRDAEAADSFEESDAPRGNAARLRGYELYPWVANNSLSPTIQGLGTSGIYRFTADYTSGELTAYIDGGTTDVFRESKRQKLSTVQFSNSITATNGSLDVRLNATHDSGPLKIEVMDSETGVSTNGDVEVDGEPVGETGADGTLWIVEPRGQNRITVTNADGETVSVFLPS